MGFRQLAAEETVRAKFVSLAVFAIEGITVASAEVASTTIKNQECRLVLARSVNDACRTLLSDDYIDNEPEWAEDKKCCGPYLMAMFGPTQEYTASSGHIKEEENGDITTYDCFPAAKSLLRDIANDTLPELLTSLTCNLFTPGQHFRIRVIENTICGTTSDNRRLHDIRLSMSATGFSPVEMSSERVQASLAATITLASRLNIKVARFFNLALFEEDDLKRFLYFFLALEVQTHVTFSGINHSSQINSFIPSITVVGQSAVGLLQRHTDNMKNLRDRFIWCALCSWTSIADSDVTEFKRLKNIRDKIAHGSIDVPPTEAVRAIEELTIKVLLQ